MGLPAGNLLTCDVPRWSLVSYRRSLTGPRGGGRDQGCSGVFGNSPLAPFRPRVLSWTRITPPPGIAPGDLLRVRRRPPREGLPKHLERLHVEDAGGLEGPKRAVRLLPVQRCKRE